MKVELIHYTPLSVMVTAGRTAWDSFHKGGVYKELTDDISEDDLKFLKRIIIKHKHGSVAEHVSYNFQVHGVSRALLQELARHRIASYTVKSTRYTLKELKEEDSLNCFDPDDFDRARKYLHYTDNSIVDNTSVRCLEMLRRLIKGNVSNDEAKYALPESYLTSLVFTINARSLQNFINLRTSSAALKEIRDLAIMIRDTVPKSHRFLYEKAED